MGELRNLVNCTCHLGECPVWDAENHAIIWVDITAGEIHQFLLQTRQHTVITLGQMVGAVALCQDGNFIGALQEGIAIIDRQTGRYAIQCRPEAGIASNRFNDAKCDPAGRFWAGSVSMTEEHGAGNVHCINADFSFNKLIEGTTISNGMAWSINQQEFYFIDTPTRKVFAYAFDNGPGLIDNERVAIDFSNEEGLPDGMTIDSEGMLWIGHWNGWQLSRWNPLTGEKLHSIRMPVANVTSCAFGGADFGDLFITSARKGLTDAELKKQSWAGSIFIIENCGFTGLPPCRFTTRPS